jgi:hypothetical protein
MIIEFERLVVTRATENEMRNARTQNYGTRNRNCFHMCGPRIWTPSPRGSVGKPLKRGRVPPPVPKCQKLPVSFSHVDPVISVCLWRERDRSSDDDDPAAACRRSEHAPVAVAGQPASGIAHATSMHGTACTTTTVGIQADNMHGWSQNKRIHSSSL